MTTPFTVENELLGMFPPKSDIGTPSRAWCMRAREYHIDLNEFPAKEEALGRSGGWLESFHQRSTGGARRA